MCEGTDDSYLFLKTDSAHVRYSLDSPGKREREMERVELTRIPCQHVVNILVKTLVLIGLGNWVNLLSAQAQPISSPQL